MSGVKWQEQAVENEAEEYYGTLMACQMIALLLLLLPLPRRRSLFPLPHPRLGLLKFNISWTRARESFFSLPLCEVELPQKVLNLVVALCH